MHATGLILSFSRLDSYVPFMKHILLFLLKSHLCTLLTETARAAAITCIANMFCVRKHLRLIWFQSLLEVLIIFVKDLQMTKRFVDEVSV